MLSATTKEQQRRQAALPDSSSSSRPSRLQLHWRELLPLLPMGPAAVLVRDLLLLLVVEVVVVFSSACLMACCTLVTCGASKTTEPCCGRGQPGSSSSSRVAAGRHTARQHTGPGSLQGHSGWLKKGVAWAGEAPLHKMLTRGGKALMN